MIKSVVAAPFIPVSSLIGSHRGAQGVIYADMIQQRGEEHVDVDLGAKVVKDFNDYDRLYVYHGNDWTGGLNLYGGVQGFPYAENTKRIFDFKGEVFSLGIDFPDYHSLFAHKVEMTRKAGVAPHPAFEQIDWDNMLRMQREAKTIKHPYVTPRVTVGDSHGISLYRPGWTVNSVPYKTLFGALKDGLLKYVTEPYTDHSFIEEVELYFGNIDVRHHLCRQEDPARAALSLADSYFQAAANLFADLPNLKKVTLRELLPIEDESRIIPQSGWYEKKPFWGSWQERNIVRTLFCDRLHMMSTMTSDYTNKVEFMRWTDYLLNDKGQLDFKCMEYKRSVHLSRASYPHWNGFEFHERLLDPKRTGIPMALLQKYHGEESTNKREKKGLTKQDSSSLERFF